MASVESLKVPSVEQHSRAIKELNENIKDVMELQSQDTKDYYEIKKYIEKFNLTFSVADVIRGYKAKVVNDYYVSCTMDMVIGECYGSISRLIENGFK